MTFGTPVGFLCKFQSPPWSIQSFLEHVRQDQCHRFSDINARKNLKHSFFLYAEARFAQDNNLKEHRMH